MIAYMDKSINYILENSFNQYRKLIIDHCGKAETYPRRTIISCSGKLNSKMFFLLGGMIKIYTCNIDGYVRILGYHKKNTIFAMDSLCEGLPAVVTTESVSQIQIIPLTEGDLLLINTLDHMFLLDLAKYYCTVLRLMCFDAENQSIIASKARLANFMYLYLYNQQNKEDMEINLSQNDLASAINCSRVQVARICSGMKKEGIITTRRGNILIKNPEKLENMVNSHIPKKILISEN